jgi:hypothetical protein
MKPTMQMLSSSFWLIAAFALGRIAAEGPSWTVYHSWNGGQDYSRRGVLEWSQDDEALVVTNDKGALDKESLQAMLDYGWYSIKIDTLDGDYVLATVPACNLRRANFKDEFSVTLPRTSERQITSLAYTPLVSPLAPLTCDEYSTIPETIELSSKVQVALDTPGLTLRAVLPHTKPPPGLAFLTHPNAKKGSAAGAGDPTVEPEPMGGFFRRYWYVLLPLFLANFIGPSAETPPAQEEGDGSGQEEGEGAPAALPAAGSPGKKSSRRGKRG